jgi:hypothetical protein
MKERWLAIRLPSPDLALGPFFHLLVSILGMEL